MHEFWITPFLPQLLAGSNTIKVTTDEGAWIEVSFYAGNMVGAIFTCFTVDRVGRRDIIVLSNIPSLASWLILAFADTVAIFILGQFMGGFSAALVYTALPLYVGEIASESRIRAFLAASTMTACHLGNILIDLGSYSTNKQTCVISSVLPVIAFICLVYMPKSPYFLIMRGQTDKAKQALQKFQLNDNVEMKFQEIQESVILQLNEKGKFLELFTDRCNRRAVFILLLLMDASVLTGAPAIVFYNQIIFANADNIISPISSSLIYNILNFLSIAFSTTFIIDRISRRALSVISLVGCVLTTFLIGVVLHFNSFMTLSESFDILLVILMLLYVTFYNLSIVFMVYILTAEMFPMNVKTFASYLSYSYYVVLTMVVDKLFQVITDNFGLYVPFYIFSGFSALHIVLVFKYMPETTGRTLEEIQDYLKELFN